MARTKTTGDAASSFMPAAGGGIIMKFCDEEEVRIENRKIKVPVRLTGEEPDMERATSFTRVPVNWTQKSAISLRSRELHISRIMPTRV